MSGSEAARRLGLCAILAVSLALPAGATESAPPPGSADPLIAEALRFEHGDGVARNAGRAAEMYCAAARQGHAEAAYRLAWMYAEGAGIERDRRHAAALFHYAAAQGYAPAAKQEASGDGRLPLCMSLPPPPLVAPSPRTTEDEPNTLPARAADDAPPPAVARAAPLAAPTPREQIVLAIARWANAWSGRDIERYLAAYAPEFQARPGESRRQWEQQRRARIAGKAWIGVELRDLDLTIEGVEGDRAIARFRQDYRSDKGRDTAVKTLTLMKTANTWLILREHSEPALPAAASR